MEKGNEKKNVQSTCMKQTNISFIPIVSSLFLFLLFKHERTLQLIRY